MFHGAGRLSTVKKADSINIFFNARFFSYLNTAVGNGREGTACVAKYFVTGVQPAFLSGLVSPLDVARMITNGEVFNGMCGLTREQVEIITKTYLGERWAGQINEICYTLRERYSGYYFASEGDSDSEQLYNPHFVYSHLLKIKGERLRNLKTSTLFHPAKILNSIVDTDNPSSMTDILRLVSEGSIESDISDMFSLEDIVGKDNKMTLSLLVHLGALTRDLKEGMLKVPNGMMKDLVITTLIDIFLVLVLIVICRYPIVS
jgi:Predicted AAA-ATPase